MARSAAARKRPAHRRAVPAKRGRISTSRRPPARRPAPLLTPDLKRELGGCQAGKIMIHVSPKGMVQPCAELSAVSHYTEFSSKEYPGPNCGRCFDSCRAEPQAPLTLRRLTELSGMV